MYTCPILEGAGVCTVCARMSYSVVVYAIYVRTFVYICSICLVSMFILCCMCGHK